MAADDPIPAGTHAAIRTWLHEQVWPRTGDGSTYETFSKDPLVGLLRAARAVHWDDVEFSPEVLQAWHRLLMTKRQQVDHSEHAFIDIARREGLTWERIAEVLALDSAEAAQNRQQELADEIARTHPSRSPTPWTG